MLRKIVIGLMALALLLVEGCAPQVVPVPRNVNEINVVIDDRGVKADYIEVVVRNFYAGARAEMTYRIYNNTSESLTPEIFPIMDVDVSKYSRADGAVKAPGYVGSWVEIPPLIEITPNTYKDFIVALQMPSDAKKPADKIGFQIGVAGKSGGNLQPAIGIWWLVSMR